EAPDDDDERLVLGASAARKIERSQARALVRDGDAFATDGSGFEALVEQRDRLFPRRLPLLVVWRQQELAGALVVVRAHVRGALAHGIARRLGQRRHGVHGARTRPVPAL